MIEAKNDIARAYTSALSEREENKRIRKGTLLTIIDNVKAQRGIDDVILLCAI